jgi:hypothetical protein
MADWADMATHQAIATILSGFYHVLYHVINPSLRFMESASSMR